MLEFAFAISRPPLPRRCWALRHRRMRGISSPVKRFRSRRKFRVSICVNRRLRKHWAKASAACSVIRASATCTTSPRCIWAAAIATAAIPAPRPRNAPTFSRGSPMPGPVPANPVRSYTLLNHESPEFIRFVNPGDLRVAHISCGGLPRQGSAGSPQEHDDARLHAVGRGLLQQRRGAVQVGPLWRKLQHERRAAALANGAAADGRRNRKPRASCRISIRCRASKCHSRAIFCASSSAAAASRREVGIPERKKNPAGRARGSALAAWAPKNRTDPVFIGLQKTRLLDPTLNFLGTNDHPGDYRSSGCTACHVIYANDRSPVHSGPYAKYGHSRHQASPPIRRFRRTSRAIRSTTSLRWRIPTSQCIVCHMHPGTNVMNTYSRLHVVGRRDRRRVDVPGRATASDRRTNGPIANVQPRRNGGRGLWSNPEFLANWSNLNSSTKHTQFADFHGHGWVFRAVFKKDRSGNLLDYLGRHDSTNPATCCFKPPMAPPTAGGACSTANSATACRCI